MTETEESKLEITGEALDKRIRYIASLNGVSVDTLRKAFDDFLKCFEKKDKDYLIIHYGGRINVIKGAKSFKDALLEIEPISLLNKSLEAFDDTEVDKIVETYNDFSMTEIKQVYVIEEKIY